MLAWQSRRLRFLLGVIGLWWLYFATLRWVFVQFFAPSEQLQKAGDAALWQALGVGLRFDLRWALLLSFPTLLLLSIPRFNLWKNAWVKRLHDLYLLLALLTTSLIYVIDFGHYDYLGLRINATVYRFAADAAISAQMLWESYPVIRIMSGWLLGSVVLFILMGRWQQRQQRHAGRTYQRPHVVLTSVVFLVFFFFGTLGRVTGINWHNPVPLRWNHAYVSGHAAVGATGIHPLQNLWDTSLIPQQDYDVEKARQYYAVMRDWLGVESTDFEKNYLDRDLQPVASALSYQRTPNVIYIMLESTGASRLSGWGNPLATSPNLDRIANEGWKFQNCYVPVVGTAKTVWASITGIPDIARAESATRNPDIAHQRLVMNEWQEHKKFYFIGGSADWANMSALITQSIDGVTLMEEQHWTAPVVDVWGISDLDLFKAADKVLTQQQTPFFAYIQTAGNHKPYTVPAQNDGFVVDKRDEAEVSKWGFQSVAQYNAIRLLDFNIGKFFEMAQAGGYLDNTIFVMFGDHNSRTTTLPHLPAYHKALDLESFNVPCIIYSPRYLQPKVITQTVGLVDLNPTIAGLLGKPYRNTTFGRDIQTIPLNKTGVFLVLVEGNSPVIGLVNDEFLLRMNEDGSAASLHQLHSDAPERDVQQQFPEIFTEMKDMTHAQYETARYQFYRNRDLDSASKK